jgi:hypothetical protein
MNRRTFLKLAALSPLALLPFKASSYDSRCNGVCEEDLREVYYSDQVITGVEVRDDMMEEFFPLPRGAHGLERWDYIDEDKMAVEVVTEARFVRIVTFDLFISSVKDAIARAYRIPQNLLFLDRES